MSKQANISLHKLKNGFIRKPFPTMFSRIVSALLTYVDRDTCRAWPSQKKLASQVGCNVKTVKRNLEAARKLGLFMIESVGAEELRNRVGSKRKLAPHHRFTIYTMDVQNPLWDANDVEIADAKKIIQLSTHKGVDRRCKKAGVTEVSVATMSE